MSQEMESTRTLQPFRWAVAEQALTRGTESGDAYIFTQFPGGALAAVVDGLGHGPKAAVAAKTAIETLASHAQESAPVLVQSCHEALRRTRGAVLSLACFTAPPTNPLDPICQMTWLGVGNVKGVLLRVDPQAKIPREWLAPRGGIVGYQLPNPRSVVLPIRPGDTLIFATDGIYSDFVEGLALAAFQARDNPPQAIAEHILARSRRGSDDALLLVVQHL